MLNTPLDTRLGMLVREGVTVYYAHLYPERRYVENTKREEIEALLDLEPHRIVHIGTGVRPSELRFQTKHAAQKWLDGYGVTPEYKAANYRIVPDRN